jgi:hypothetical protein
VWLQIAGETYAAVAPLGDLPGQHKETTMKYVLPLALIIGISTPALAADY